MIALAGMTVRGGCRLQKLVASGDEQFSADSAPLSMSDRDEEIASGLPQNLDALPRLNGFRLRGLEMTRLEINSQPSNSQLQTPSAQLPKSQLRNAVPAAVPPPAAEPVVWKFCPA